LIDIINPDSWRKRNLILVEAYERQLSVLDNDYRQPLRVKSNSICIL